MLNSRLVGKLAYALWDKKEGGERLAEYARLRNLQYESPEAITAYQQHRLNKLLQHSYEQSPWYRPLLEKAGYHPSKTVDLQWLQTLPVTTKADIRNNTSRFIARNYDKTELCRAKTGGSTGVSLQLYFDHRAQQWRNAAQMYADNLAGWQMGDRVAAIWGNPPVHKGFKPVLRAKLLERTIYLDTMDINPQSVARFVAQWQRFKPQVIFGHAHSIYLLAKELQASGINTLRPKGIVATSMMLLDHERATIEQVFQCPVTNRYGCEEVGLIAVECEQHNGMHINSPHIVLECLDADNQPVQPGQTGKLVLTDLNNYGMPLIRYRVEDMGVLANRPCSCGRNTPLLEKLEGRVADFLKKPDGGHVAGVSLVERTLTKVAGVEQMQLVQESLNEVIIRRVKGKEFNEHTDTDLIAEFRQVFPPEVTLTLEDVHKIPQEASGKYRFSICKI